MYIALVTLPENLITNNQTLIEYSRYFDIRFQKLPDSILHFSADPD